MTHTPGPWTIEHHGHGPIIYGATDIVARVDWGRGEEDEANARLIASAPETAAELDQLRAINAELLAALQHIAARLDWVVHPHSMEWNIRQVALDAIAKAEQVQS